MELFDKCMAVIFAHEGGYINDPDDLGGETNYGICKRYFPNEDIKNLTKERAKELYYEHYWNPMRLGNIWTKDSAVLEIFDMGVNAGKKRAIRMAQKIVMTATDGVMGPITGTAIDQYHGFVEKYKEARRAYYRDIAKRRPKNQKFLNGWLNRVETTHL